MERHLDSAHKSFYTLGHLFGRPGRVKVLHTYRQTDERTEDTESRQKARYLVELVSVHDRIDQILIDIVVDPGTVICVLRIILPVELEYEICKQLIQFLVFEQPDVA